MSARFIPTVERESIDLMYVSSIFLSNLLNYLFLHLRDRNVASTSLLQSFLLQSHELTFKFAQYGTRNSSSSAGSSRARHTNTSSPTSPPSGLVPLPLRRPTLRRNSRRGSSIDSSTPSSSSRFISLRPRRTFRISWSWRSSPALHRINSLCCPLWA
jgi:hypothetical protein